MGVYLTDSGAMHPVCTTHWTEQTSQIQETQNLKTRPLKTCTRRGGLREAKTITVRTLPRNPGWKGDETQNKNRS